MHTIHSPIWKERREILGHPVLSFNIHKWNIRTRWPKQTCICPVDYHVRHHTDTNTAVSELTVFTQTHNVSVCVWLSGVGHASLPRHKWELFAQNQTVTTETTSHPVRKSWLADSQHLSPGQYWRRITWWKPSRPSISLIMGPTFYVRSHINDCRLKWIIVIEK